MGHYRGNLRDLEFNLFEVFRIQDRLGAAPYEELDPETAHEVLREVQRLAEGPLADSFADADRNPPVYDPATKTVTMPASFKDSYRKLFDAEWWRLDLPQHLGGSGAPSTLRWAASELLLGANPEPRSCERSAAFTVPSPLMSAGFDGSQSSASPLPFASVQSVPGPFQVAPAEIACDCVSCRQKPVGKHAAPTGCGHVDGPQVVLLPLKTPFCAAHCSGLTGPMQVPSGRQHAPVGKHTYPVHVCPVGPATPPAATQDAGGRVMQPPVDAKQHGQRF